MANTESASVFLSNVYLPSELILAAGRNRLVMAVEQNPFFAQLAQQCTFCHLQPGALLLPKCFLHFAHSRRRPNVVEDGGPLVDTAAN